MAYKPFKMKGHSLPGINQKSETENLPDGRSASSPFQQSPAKHNWWVLDQETGKNRNKAHAHQGDQVRSLEGVKKPDNVGPKEDKGDKAKRPKKSPGKWAQFIPMALSAISSMKKNKE